jgi:uncharacterized protein
MPDNWTERLPATFYVALAEFNRGDYFACHETLEALWIPETGPVRELYQGVLQIAVGCHHLTQRANWMGAVNLLERGARRLERTGITTCYGVDWRGLIASADRLQTHLRQLSRTNVTDYDLLLLPHITYQTE